MGRRRSTSHQTTIRVAAQNAGQAALTDSMATILETVYIPQEVKGPAHIKCLQRVSDEWAARLFWMTYYAIPSVDITRMPFLSSELRLQKEYGKLLWEISKLIRVLWETVPAYRKDYLWASPLVVWQQVAIELRKRDQRIKVKCFSKTPTKDERSRWKGLSKNLQNDDVMKAVETFGEGFKMPHFTRVLQVSTEARLKLRGQHRKDFNIDGFDPFMNQLEKMRSESFSLPAPYQATCDGLATVEGKPHMSSQRKSHVDSLSTFSKEDPNRLAVALTRIEINEAEGYVDWHFVEIRRERGFGESLIFVR